MWWICKHHHSSRVGKCIEHHPNRVDIISNKYTWRWCAKSPKWDIYIHLPNLVFRRPPDSHSRFASRGLALLFSPEPREGHPVPERSLQRQPDFGPGKSQRVTRDSHQPQVSAVENNWRLRMLGWLQQNDDHHGHNTSSSCLIFKSPPVFFLHS